MTSQIQNSSWNVSAGSASRFRMVSLRLPLFGQLIGRRVLSERNSLSITPTIRLSAYVFGVVTLELQQHGRRMLLTNVSLEEQFTE